MMFAFLKKNCPLFSRALIAPWRLCFLAAGLVLLCVGSHVTPSDDWDYPVSFIMGVCAYVFAPWTVRVLVYRRWKWLAVAFLLMWVSIDGVYSLYWWSRGFDALQIFRGANAIYCLPLYFALGFAMNVEMRCCEEVSSTAGLVRSCFTWFQKHALHAVITCFLMLLFICGLLLVTFPNLVYCGLGTWLNNGNNPNPPQNCHELEIRNRFPSLSGNIKYNFSKGNFPFTFNLNPSSSGWPYLFFFDITSNSVLRLALKGAEFSVSNGVATLRHDNIEALAVKEFDRNGTACAGPFVVVKVWNGEHGPARWKIEGWESTSFYNRVKFEIDGTCPMKFPATIPLCIVEAKGVGVRNATNIVY